MEANKLNKNDIYLNQFNYKDNSIQRIKSSHLTNLNSFCETDINEITNNKTTDIDIQGISPITRAKKASRDIIGIGEKRVISRYKDRDYSANTNNNNISTNNNNKVLLTDIQEIKESKNVNTHHSNENLISLLNSRSKQIVKEINYSKIKSLIK